MSAYELGSVYKTVCIIRLIWLMVTETILTSNIPDAELEAMKHLDYNWLDDAWHSSVSQRHSVTVNGGSEKSDLFRKG
ncbi:MAG: hypothetical protein ACLUVG_06865 [Phocaeicola vulgatus]